MHRSPDPAESDADVHERPTLLPAAEAPLSPEPPAASTRSTDTPTAPDRPTDRPRAPVTKEEVERLFLEGDFRAALTVARHLLEDDPGDRAVIALARSSELRFRHRCIAKLGSVHRVPRFICDPAAYRRLALDHRTGFVAALVDGTTSIEQILSVSGLPEGDALAILVSLVELGVIESG